MNIILAVVGGLRKVIVDYEEEGSYCMILFDSGIVVLPLYIHSLQGAIVLSYSSTSQYTARSYHKKQLLILRSTEELSSNFKTKSRRELEIPFNSLYYPRLLIYSDPLTNC